MSDHIPVIDQIKIEGGSNTLLQSYINTFNKEIEKHEPPLQEMEESDDGLNEMESNNTLEISPSQDSIQIGDVERGEEIITEDESNVNGGTYFIDAQGRYYFQSDSQQVMSSVGEVITPDDIMLTEDAMVETDPYQTVTLVPSDVAGEVSYVLIVQQPVDKNEDENGKPDNHLTVYDFNENEELENVGQNVEAVEEEEKAKILPVKQQRNITKAHMCSYCNYTTSKKYLLSRHMKSHSEERPHKCTVCSRGFKTLASLQNHVNTHTGTKPHKCRFCNSAFTTSGELVRHVRYRHTHEKPHKCSECDYASVELSKLKRHARCHTGERPYQCPHCTYASPDTFKLKRHLRTHTGEKPYECEYCHVCFTQSNSLKAHKLTHNVGDKPVFHCQLCPTTCGRKTDLRIHVQKLHISDKPIKCRRCGKSFPDRYHFKIHVKTHAGEKCFKCDFCPYASASLQHLNSHMLVHTDEKTFACEKCDQTFRQKQLLKRHQNLYHNPEYVPPLPKEKSHRCIDCGKSFRHKGNLIRHMATHDPDSDIHEKTLALKIGRQRKLQILNPQTIENTQDIVFENESVSDSTPNSEGLPHYVVFEVIHVPEENSSEEISVMPTKHVPEEFEDEEEEDEEEEEEDEDENKSLSKNDEIIVDDKQSNTEKDVANCFGFDVDEVDEDLEDKMNLYEMKFLRE